MVVMAKRKRITPTLSEETQEIINQLRPEAFDRYESISERSLASFVTGWVAWALNKKQKRPDGSTRSSASPYVRQQVNLWMAAGRPYEWNGGLDDDAEKEHDRADAVQRRRKEKLEGKTRTRRRRKRA